MFADTDDGFPIPGNGARAVRRRDDVLGLVLAGGAGTRVGGVDKGLMPLCGRPLIEHVLERLRPQCGRVLIAANRNPDCYARLAPVVHDAGTDYAGPLAGLLAALDLMTANRQALPGWLVTVPVDCPGPPHDLVVRLRVALVDNADADCAFARGAGKAQPLFAMYRIGDVPERWLAAVQTALQQHGSAWRWHASMQAMPVDFDDADAAFDNLNTMEAVQEYERHVATS